MITDPVPQPPASAGKPPDETAPSNLETRPDNWLRWTVLAWLIAITAFHLGSASAGYSIYRDIHLGTALEYAKGSINLLKPIVTGFNLNGTPTPQELPLWQAATGLLFKLLGTWFGWANLVSLLSMFSCLYPLFRLTERFAGAECAWWTLVLFLAQPLIFIYAGEASPDGMALAASIWFMFFASKLWEEQNLKWLMLASVSGGLAAVSKLPFFMAAGLCCFFVTLSDYRKHKLVWIYLAGTALFSGAVFLLWTKYVNHCYEQAELPLVDLRASDKFMTWWYFGDLKYRLSPVVWIKGSWRILTSLFGSFALVAVFLLGMVWRRPIKLACWWLAAGAITTFIFFHIVLHHSHYYLMFVPGVAMISGQMAAWLSQVIRGVPTLRRVFTSLILVAALFLSTVQGVLGSHVIVHFNKYPRAMADLISRHTTPQDKLLIQGGGWGGELLFLAKRRGLSTWNTQLLEDPQTYLLLKKNGFTKLVMVSESPLLAAVRHASSTSPTVDRESYRQNATPKVDTFPTILENEDILIKQLP